MADTKVGSVYYDVELETANFDQQINRTQGKINAFAKSAAGLFVLDKVRDGVSAIVSAGREYEDAFTGVLKTTDGLDDGFGVLTSSGQALRDEMKQLATQVPATFAEIAQVAELGGQLGVAQDQLLDFSRTVIDISESTNLVAEEAATGIAQLANILRVPTDELGAFARQYGNVIVTLGNNFATTERDIQAFAERIAGAGAIAGLSAAEVAGIGTAFASIGVEAEAGGTAIQKVLNGMTEAVATGNEDLEHFAATAGLSVAEFSDLYENDAAGAFQRFVEGLGTQGDAAFGTLEDLELGNERVIRAFLSVAQAGDLLGNTLEAGVNASLEGNTALADEANRRYATFSSQLDIFRNEVSNIGDALFQKMLPALEGAVNVATGFIQALKDGNPLAQAAAVAIGVLATAFTGLAVIGTAINLMRLFGIQSAASAVKTTAIWIAKTTVMVARVVANFALMAASSIASVISMTVATVAQFAVMAAGALASALGIAASYLIAFAPWLIAAAIVGGIVFLIIQHWDTLKQTAINIFNAIKDFIMQHWEILLTIFTGGIGLIVALVINNWDTIKATTEAVFNAIKNFLTATWDAIKAVFLAVFNAIRTLVTTYFNIYKTIITTVFNAVKAFITTVFNAYRTIITTAFNAIRTVITTVLNAVRSFITSRFNSIRNTMSNAANSARSLVTNAFNRMRDAVSNAITGVLNFVRELPGRILSALGNVGNLLFDSGKNIIQGLLNGLDGAKDAVFRKAGEIADGVKSFFSNPLGIFSPSRVFDGFGVNLIEGLVQGIDGEAGQVKRSIDRITDLATIDAQANFDANVRGRTDIGSTAAQDQSTNRSSVIQDVGSRARTAVNVIVAATIPGQTFDEESLRELGLEILQSVGNENPQVRSLLT